MTTCEPSPSFPSSMKALLRLSPEITTKASKTRARFTRRTAENLRLVLKENDLAGKVRAEHARMYMEYEDPAAVEVTRRVFGVHSVSPADERAFTVVLRNDLFRFVRHLSRRAWGAAAEMLEPPPEEEAVWDAERIAAAMAPYFEEYDAIRTDPAARSPRNTQVEKGEDAWTATQIVVDPEDNGDWFVRVRVPLDRSRMEQRPVLELLDIGT